MFLVKGVLKICSKFTTEHSCQNGISIKLESNFIKITTPHGWSPINLLHIFRTPFTKNTYGRILYLLCLSIGSLLSQSLFIITVSRHSKSDEHFNANTFFSKFDNTLYIILDRKSNSLSLLVNSLSLPMKKQRHFVCLSHPRLE